MKKSALAFAFASALVISTPALARDQIRIVGSSTVYPFVTTVAETFGKKTGNPTPIVESTGTGGGFKLFCGGTGDDTPDLANASRPIKDSEKELCAKSGVKGTTEIKIGYDGIVVANIAAAETFNLTREQLFLALAKQVPVDGKIIDNPYKTWNDLDGTLPQVKISVYGPPPTSGTRDAFVEMVMEKACTGLPEFKAAYTDEDARKKACGAIREDGTFIEAGENDNLIVQKLEANQEALGIFGFSFLDMNRDALHGVTIDGSTPTFEHIADGSYPISRPLFVYLKNDHLSNIKGIREFLKELVSGSAIGEDGYVIEKGLVPLHADELKKVQATVETLK